MLKLLIWIVLGYVIYRFALKGLGGGGRSRERMQGHHHPQVDDDMVKDPECGAYFPLRDSVTATVQGRTLHFCSTECRDRYLARPSQSPPS